IASQSSLVSLAACSSHVRATSSFSPVRVWISTFSQTTQPHWAPREKGRLSTSAHPSSIPALFMTSPASAIAREFCAILCYTISLGSAAPSTGSRAPAAVGLGPNQGHGGGQQVTCLIPLPISIGIGQHIE